MQDIIKEYGPAIITVTAIISLVAVISFIVGNSDQSLVGKAFANLITTFFTKAMG